MLALLFLLSLLLSLHGMLLFVYLFLVFVVCYSCYLLFFSLCDVVLVVCCLLSFLFVVLVVCYPYCVNMSKKPVTCPAQKGLLIFSSNSEEVRIFFL